MKIWILAAYLMTAIFALNADDILAAKDKVECAACAPKHAYHEIHVDQLKTWYDNGEKMVVLDARSKAYFDGTLLPGAKWLSSDSSENEILAMVPEKSALIAVYCASSECPAGGWLADKLVSMGYTNVNKYPEGLRDWMQKGYPTVK